MSIMGITTNSIKEHIEGSIVYNSSTTSETNNNSKADIMYSYALDNDDELLSTNTDSMNYNSGELTPRLKNLPAGYLSISSFAKSYIADSEGLFSSSPSENDFCTTPVSFFLNSSNRRRRKISLGQEALPALEVQSEHEEENINNDSGKMSSLKLSELIPSFASISLPKFPERSWFCNTCRKPKDECHCMCVIC